MQHTEDVTVDIGMFGRASIDGVLGVQKHDVMLRGLDVDHIAPHSGVIGLERDAHDPVLEEAVSLQGNVGPVRGLSQSGEVTELLKDAREQVPLQFRYEILVKGSHHPD